MSDLSSEYDRDIVCGCPYCGLVRLGKLIPEPSESERYQAMLRCAQRNTPADREALDRARANEDMPEEVREAIKRTSDYQQLKQVSEMRAEMYRGTPGAERQPISQNPAARTSILDSIKSAVEAANPGATVRVIGSGVGGLPEFRDFVMKLAGKVNAPEAATAPEAYEAQMNAALDRLQELLDEDEEMDSTDRKVARLRLAEIRTLWDAR